METISTDLHSNLAEYLSSGIIKGMSKNIAKSVVEEFGISTFDVLESAPHMLTQIKGISLKKAIAFSESFNRQPYLRHVLLFLSNMTYLLPTQIRL